MLGTIFLNVVIFIGGACGVLSCLYMVLSLIAVPVSYTHLEFSDKRPLSVVSLITSS